MKLKKLNVIVLVVFMIGIIGIQGVYAPSSVQDQRARHGQQKVPCCKYRRALRAGSESPEDQPGSTHAGAITIQTSRALSGSVTD